MLDDPWHCVACVQQGCRSRGACPPPQILEDQLTLSRPGSADYANHITTSLLRIFNLPTALYSASGGRWQSGQMSVARY